METVGETTNGKESRVQNAGLVDSKLGDELDAESELAYGTGPQAGQSTIGLLPGKHQTRSSKREARHLHTSALVARSWELEDGKVACLIHHRSPDRLSLDRHTDRLRRRNERVSSTKPLI